MPAADVRYTQQRECIAQIIRCHGPRMLGRRTALGSFSCTAEPNHNSSANGGRLPMPNEGINASHSGLDVAKLLLELEVPFSPDQVRWRVTNTTNDKKRGQ